MSDPDGTSFALGRAFKPHTVDEHAVEHMVSILDVQDALPSVQRLRTWALAAGALRPGEKVIDLGSGTGTMTRRLAELVGPDGTALGIEPNGMLRAVAEDRAADAGSPAVFCQGLATEIPLPRESVDLVWCERVLQHVPDPQAALVEIARVLRPGGRALLLDADHGSRVSSDIDPEVEQAIATAFMGQMASPRVARHIPRKAMAAGLAVDADIGSSAVVFPRELLLDFPMLRLAADQAVADGLITRQQADEAVWAHSEAARQGWAFTAVTVFGFVCRKG